MKPEMIAILGILAAFALLEIIFTNFFRKPGQTRQDVIVESVSILTLVLVTQPLALLGGGTLAHIIAPGAQDSLAHLPLIAGIALFLIFDDMMHNIGTIAPPTRFPDSISCTARITMANICRSASSTGTTFSIIF